LIYEDSILLLTDKSKGRMLSDKSAYFILD